MAEIGWGRRSFVKTSSPQWSRSQRVVPGARTRQHSKSRWPWQLCVRARQCRSYVVSSNCTQIGLPSGKSSGLAHAADALEAGAKPMKVVDLVLLHAKIGQLTLKNEFLERALTKAGLLRAKLLNRQKSQTACYPTGQTPQSQLRLGVLPAQAGECRRPSARA